MILVYSALFLRAGGGGRVSLTLDWAMEDVSAVHARKLKWSPGMAACATHEHTNLFSPRGKRDGNLEQLV